MSILLNDNLNVAAAKPTDARYGPWGSPLLALQYIPAYQRYKGLTVGILVAGVVNEYWFDDGVADSDLVVKIVAGNNGASGATGATGQSGEQGSTGATGQKGDQGSTGATGQAGEQGSTGATGQAGEQGSTGATGAKGDQGSTGATGQSGEQGSTGATGVKGDQGLTGLTGPSGMGFSVFATGTSLDSLNHPGVSPLNIGQFAILTGGQMYVYMGTDGSTGPGLGSTGPNNQYSYVADLTDETVVTGATGATGELGSTGATGAKGDQGSTGATGELGSTGATGAKGEQGSTGATGQAGEQGSTGATGQAGDQGSTGATGEQGSTGATGQKGDQGSTGATGQSGEHGATGATGQKGDQGSTGATGEQGSTGATGVAGVHGATGATGDLGSTGATGPSGAMGATGVSDRYHTFSTTPLTVGDGTGGKQTLTVEQGLSYSANQDVTITNTSNVANHMHGYVFSYNKTNGVLVVTIVTQQGDTSQPYSDWTVNLDGAIGAVGPTGSSGATGATGEQGSTGASGADAANSLYATSIGTQVQSMLTGGAQPALAADWKTKTIVQVLDAILFPTKEPTYTIPTISLNTSQTGTKEIGSTLSQTLTLAGTKNDAGAFTSLTISRTGGAGAGVLATTNSPTQANATDIDEQYGYADPNNPNKTYTLTYDESYVVVSGTTSWAGKGNCSAGVAKNDNKGAADTGTPGIDSSIPQAARTDFASDTDTVTGIYPYFYGKSSTQPSAADVAGFIQNGTNSTKVLASANGTVSVTFAATNHYIWLAIPTGSTEKQSWYNTGLNNGTIGEVGSFILAPDAHDVTSPATPTPYWTNVSYDIYISSGATQTTGAIEFRNS